MKNFTQDQKHEISNIQFQARNDCQSLEGSFNWNEAIETRIYELASTELVADEAVCQINTQIFTAAGII